MNTQEAKTQLGGFNQRLLMRQSNNHFPYSGTHQHKDESIDTFFSSVESHDVTINVELVVGTKTLLTDVYAIRSKSDLNIAKILLDRFREHRIPIKIWSDNAQEELMESVKNFYAPMEWEVSNLKCTNRNITLRNAVVSILKAPLALSLIVLAHQAGPISYAWNMLSQ